MIYYTVEDIKFYNTIQLCFEAIFLIEMLLGFVTEYVDMNNKSVKDVYKISKRYLKQGFIQDIIPLIPFNWISYFKNSKYLYLIKSIRLIQAYEILDVRTFNA